MVLHIDISLHTLNTQSSFALTEDKYGVACQKTPYAELVQWLVCQTSNLNISVRFRYSALPGKDGYPPFGKRAVLG